MRSRLKKIYKSTLPVIYSVTFENIFNKTSGVLYFNNKEDVDYLYKIANHVKYKTSAMKSTSGNISDMTLDIYDYGLIRINQMIHKAVYKSENLSDIICIDNRKFIVQQIRECPIAIYIN